MVAPRMLTYKGVTKPIREWALEVGITREAISYRLKQGWTVEEALETPPSCKKGAQCYICIYPSETCYSSKEYGYCCVDCHKAKNCEERCLNHPTKCGALIKKQKEI